MCYPPELRINWWDSPETRASKRFWRLAWLVEQERNAAPPDGNKEGSSNGN